MKLRRIAAYAALVFTLPAAGSRPAAAATISVGTFDPSTSPFVVPIEITGAVELITWQFDLAFDPSVVQIHEFCDPFAGDPFCDLLTVANGPYELASLFDPSAPSSPRLPACPLAIRLPTSVQIYTGRVLSTSLLKFLNPRGLGL